MSSMLASAQISTTGNDPRTNVKFAIERLKDKFPSALSFDDLADYVLSAGKRRDEYLLSLIRGFLRVNPKVNYDAAADTYRYKPFHNIASSEDLLAYFQKQDSVKGLGIKELKEVWTTVEEDIDQLAKEHKVLVSRNKRDNHVRMIWPNDPSLVSPMQKEFVTMWHAIPLPTTEEDVIKDLSRMGHTPTGELVKQEAVQKVEKKKKKQRRGHKITNVHMAGLFRDYSSQRPTAGK